jgi:hypothetical protein
MLMCLHHWRKVPKNLQTLVWRYYRPGQEIDKRPSLEYLAVQRIAVAWVASDEGYEQEAIKAFGEAYEYALKSSSRPMLRLAACFKLALESAHPIEVELGPRASRSTPRATPKPPPRPRRAPPEPRSALAKRARRPRVG